ncbi:MAG: NAD(P)H-quinone oxidoreductase [Acidobacteriota bacterium]|nr:NAD(P)H-quinone oxidoreductase [Acidobacteriota bacterium]
MMDAAAVKEGGGVDSLTIEKVPKPKPAAGQLLIAVHAAGVNRADILQRKGFYPPPPGASTILGLELAGVVDQVGPDVTGFSPGDRVFGLVEGGAYAQYCTMHAALAMPIPAEWDFTFAAAIAETFYTAGETLFSVGELSEGEHLLIHAGGSGVGSTAIQMARTVGAHIYTTAGSEEKLDRCRQLGAHVGIPYKTEDFAQKIRSLTRGEGIHMVLDFIGAAYLARNLSVLRRKGRLVVVGLLGGARAELDLGLILRKQLKIHGSVMRSLPLDEKAAIRKRFCSRWLPLLERGELKPVISEEIPFSRVRDAHQMMEENRHFGKIVLRIQP